MYVLIETNYSTSSMFRFHQLPMHLALKSRKIVKEQDDIETQDYFLESRIPNN